MYRTKRLDPLTIEAIRNELETLRVPELSDFGLTVESYADLEWSVNRYFKRGQSLNNYVLHIAIDSLFFLAVSYFLNYIGEGEWNIFEIMLMALVLTLLFGAMTFESVKKIGKYFLSLSIPSQIDIWHSYQKAMSSYLETKSNLEKEVRQLEQKAIRLQKMKESSYWTDQSGLEFEKSIAELFTSLGYETELTPPSGDLGIDVFLNAKTIAVQCKNTKSPVSPGAVRDLLGSMTHYGCKAGILVSTGGFTKGCYQYVKEKNIELWGLDRIISASKEVTN